MCHQREALGTSLLYSSPSGVVMGNKDVILCSPYTPYTPGHPAQPMHPLHPQRPLYPLSLGSCYLHPLSQGAGACTPCTPRGE